MTTTREQKLGYRKILFGLVLCLLPRVAMGESLPTDPQFLKKIYNEDYDGIPENNATHFDMNGAFKAFEDNGCKSHDLHGLKYMGTIEGFTKMNNYLQQDISSTAMSVYGGIQAQPSYITVMSRVQKEGCDSKWSQQTLHNLLFFLEERSLSTPERSWRDSPMN
jgi:hypothetical protein